MLGIGLIGCGPMGRRLASNLASLPATLVGLTDVDIQAAAAAGDELHAPVVASAEELVGRRDVDAVLIASPPFEHRQLTELAARAGKHVFVEKPMAANTADCDAMTAVAEQAGIVLMVGQVLRFYPAWSYMLQRVKQGDLGEPLGITLTRLNSGWGTYVREWRHSLALSGGLLMEVNSHEIDFMCQVCGDVEHVYAAGGRYGNDPADFPNLLFVTLQFKGGAVGMLHSSTLASLPEISGTILGTEGTLTYRNAFHPDGEIRFGQPGQEPEVVRVGSLKAEAPVQAELRLFLAAVLNGGPAPIPSTEGRRNVAIAEAAYLSARTGEQVAVDAGLVAAS